MKVRSKNDGKSDRTLSARPRGNTQREERSSRGNNAMGNAFADALKKLEKNNKLWAKLFALFFIVFLFPKSIAKTAIFCYNLAQFFLFTKE